MNIYNLLSSKSHNPIYLKRYYDFILYCQNFNLTNNITRKTKQNPNGIYMETHHILPKAKDLFPEYHNLKTNPWNKIELTSRQHYLAHLLLWKVYGGSQAKALYRMLCGKTENKNRITSKQYEKLKLEEHAYNIAANTGDNHWSKQEGRIHNAKINHPKGMLGKKHSEETRRKMTLMRTGDNNHFKGKQHTDEVKRIISEKNKGRMWINNGEESIMIRKDFPIPNGFVRGRHKSQDNGVPDFTLLFKWINNC